MPSGRAVVIGVLVSFLFASLPAGAISLPVVQVTNDSLDERGGATVFVRNSFTARGQILFLDTDDTVWLWDGVNPPEVVQLLPPDLNKVADHVFALGTGATAGSVIGAWRRGAAYGNVTVDGNPPSTVPLNPESVGISNGCVFMVLQDGTAQHLYQVDPATGNRTAITSGTFQTGALRVAASGCQAAFSWKDTNASPEVLKYWNGSTVTTLDSDIGIPRFVGGRIVYPKAVSGIQQVFVVDTTVPSPTPVQLSAETDASVFLLPVTDGRHVAWYRDSPGTDQIVFNGGLVMPAGSIKKVNGTEYAVQLDRGQLLWKSADDSFHYYDGRESYTLDPAPSTSIIDPWLTDGYIAFLGVNPNTGTDTEVFRITGRMPEDAAQPSPPMLIEATPGSGQVTVDWDRVIGASSYNLYVANEPGVTKDNYLTLAGGRKISSVTPPYVVTGLTSNRSYHFAVTTVEGATEGPSSRTATTTLVGTLTWQPVGGLGGTSFYSAAADATNASFVYAGANGSVYRSTNGGIDWTQVLSSATTGASRVAALAVDGPRVLGVTTTNADIWEGLTNGSAWAPILDAGGPGELNASIAIDPSNGNVAYASDFVLPDKTLADSYIIKTTTGGTAPSSWSHTPETTVFGGEIHAYALAIDAANPLRVFAAGSGTPNAVRSDDAGASWMDIEIPGGGGLYALALDPQDSDVVYATSRDHGVYRSPDSGAHWWPRTTGLTGLADGVTVFVGDGFNSIIVDPLSSSYLHLGAGNGYWYSIDGGEHWTSANSGFGTPPYIYALALTPARRLIAATDAGLFMLSLGPAPTVTNVAPSTGDAGGGTSVTITGSGFQPAAAVTFGGAAATGVSVVNGTTITATTPAHAAGAVNVVVTNFDTQSGTGTNAFTYTTTPPPAPTGVVATASTSTSVAISWIAAARASSYDIYRRGAGGTFGYLGSSATTDYTDSTAAASTSYFYRVRAINIAGESPDSASDLATTVIFTNNPIVSGLRVKAIDLAQTRAAIDAVRHLAGKASFAFSDAAVAGLTIQDVHVLQMRTAIDDARTTLGLSTGGFTDSTLAGIAVKALHFEQIRARVK